MRKLFLAIFLLALMVFSVLLFTTRGAREAGHMEMGDGNILYVGGDGPGNYSTIQDALKNANDGDTIFVYSGVYYATGDGISIFKSVRLLGEDRNTTIIDNNGAPLSIWADGVRIENFSIRNGGIWNDGVAVNYVEDVFIRNCRIYDSYTGVDVEGSSNVIISGCIIYSNNRSISIFSSPHTMVENCIFYSNENGIRISVSTHNGVHNCSFTGEGILITGDSENITHFIHDVKDNYVNEKPLLYYYRKNNMVLENMDVGELILVDCKNFKIRNTTISGTEVGIEIQKGEKISISNCSFHHNNHCGIFAGYIFDCHISNCDVYDNNFGGISISYSRNNIIDGCEVYSNRGDGIIITDTSINNLVSRCEVYNNNGNGVELFFSSKNNVSNCKIYDNEAGVSIVFSSGDVVYHNNISSNEIGVALRWGSTYATIRRCDIYSNHEGMVIGMSLLEKFLSHAKISTGDVIYENNFIKNDRHAYFFNVWHLTWDSNYWDDWRGSGRKIIRGNVIVLNTPVFPLINFDTHPAEEPW